MVKSFYQNLLTCILYCCLFSITIEIASSRYRSLNPFQILLSPTGFTAKTSNVLQLQKRLKDSADLNVVSSKLRISPPWNAPSIIWKIAWTLHHTLLPYLHYFDVAKAKDTYANLAVLWWKAISGNRWGSITYDGHVAFDMLPSFTRNIIRFPFCWLFPNLHHQNVALRTIYLDELILSELNQDDHDHDISNMNMYYEIRNDSSKALKSDRCRSYRIVTLGGGFDTRSVRFALKFQQQSRINNKSPKQPHKESVIIHLLANLFNLSSKTSNNYDNVGGGNVSFEFHEIDLPHVIDQKRAILNRFKQRRKLNDNLLPQLHKADLNNVSSIQTCLQDLNNQQSVHSNVLDSRKDGCSNSIDTSSSSSSGSSQGITIANDLLHDKQSKSTDHYTKTIIVTEAVLLYLDGSKVKPLLQACIESLSSSSSGISLCFTDRFPDIRIPASTTTSTGTTTTSTSTSNLTRSDNNVATVVNDQEQEKSDVEYYLRSLNLKLTKWLTKPGKARHMGVAVLAQQNDARI